MVNAYIPIFNKSLSNIKSPHNSLLKDQKNEKQPVTNKKYNNV
jgi:hypothetical protein